MVILLYIYIYYLKQFYGGLTFRIQNEKKNVFLPRKILTLEKCTKNLHLEHYANGRMRNMNIEQYFKREKRRISAFEMWWYLQ